VSGRPDPFAAWLDDLGRRHTAELTFTEVRRALTALSSLYVERRHRLPGRALDSAGKRAAFALFYAPLHFLVVRRVVRALGAGSPSPRRLVDLGCGTGAAGAAWAVEAGGRPVIDGLDQSPWAVAEARHTYRALALRGRARCTDLGRLGRPAGADAAVAAYAVNELDELRRRHLLGLLLDAAGRGTAVLVVEPLARRQLAWWDEWAAAVTMRGGRADEWRFPLALPDLLARLDRAAGLDHAQAGARSLWLPGTAAPGEGVTPACAGRAAASRPAADRPGGPGPAGGRPRRRR
jgi:hypothetical protein